MIWVIGGDSSTADVINELNRSDMIVTLKNIDDISIYKKHKIKVQVASLEYNSMTRFTIFNKINIILDFSKVYDIKVSYNAINIAKENNLLYIRYGSTQLTHLPDIIINSEEKLNSFANSEKRIISLIKPEILKKKFNFANPYNLFFNLSFLSKKEKIEVIGNSNNYFDITSNLKRKSFEDILSIYEITDILYLKGDLSQDHKNLINAATNLNIKICEYSPFDFEFPHRVTKISELQKLLNRYSLVDQTYSHQKKIF